MPSTRQICEKIWWGQIDLVFSEETFKLLLVEGELGQFLFEFDAF